MVFSRKKTKAEQYDKTSVKPVIHASICTGEQAAGFKSLQTGRFQEVMLVRDRRDLEIFMKAYGIKEEEITTEW